MNDIQVSAQDKTLFEESPWPWHIGPQGVYRYKPAAIPKKEFLHRLVAERTHPNLLKQKKKWYVKFADEDKTNCRRENLIVLASPTFRHERVLKKGSGFHGVSLNKDARNNPHKPHYTWVMRIQYKKGKEMIREQKFYPLDQLEQALRDHDKREIELFGNDALLNFDRSEYV